MTSPLLPAPIAWIRQSGWGRDVTAWAKDEDRPFEHEDLVHSAVAAGQQPIQIIVDLARMKRVTGGVGSESIEFITNQPPERAAVLYHGRTHEHIVAISVASWIEEGERMSSFGPSLSSSFLEDEDGDRDVELMSLLQGSDCIYLRFEEVATTSIDGRPLDGFMIVKSEDAGGESITIVPFSRSPIVLGAPSSASTYFNVKSTGTISSFTDVVLNQAEENENDLERLRSQRVEEGRSDTFSQMRMSIARGMNQIANLSHQREVEELVLQIATMRSQAKQWNRLLAGALRTMQSNEPAAVTAYPNEAPADLVQSALSGSTRSARAVKKLKSEGWATMSRHEIGTPSPDSAIVESTSEDDPVAKDRIDPETPASVKCVTEVDATEPNRLSRRKEKRLSRKRKISTTPEIAMTAPDGPPSPNAIEDGTGPEPHQEDIEHVMESAHETSDEQNVVDDEAKLSLRDVTPRNPCEDDHLSWERMTAPCTLLSSQALAKLQYLLSSNAVGRAVLRSVKSDGIIDEARDALTRQLASLATSEIHPFHTLQSPRIEEDSDLTGIQDQDGVIVVNDRALFEYASPGRIGPIKPLRETASCILYRIRRTAMDAMIVQMDAESKLNLMHWVRSPLKPSDGDDDLTWYVKGAIAIAAGSADRIDSIKERTILPGSVAVPRNPHVGEPPHRTVAQVRLRPRDMGIAQTVATRWFDQQVVRHGNMLVDHQRRDGEWTIEHRSGIGSGQSRWSVTLRLCHEDPTMIDVIVKTTMASGVKPRLPGLVREIAEATPSEGLDGILETSPRVAHDRSTVMELVRELQDPDRNLPILLMTSDAEGNWLADPQTVARQGLGALTVRLIQAGSTFDLTDALGQEYRTFGGAARLFEPRFDPDNDLPARHPRIMPGIGTDRKLAEAISRSTAMTVTRYPIKDTDPRPVPTRTNIVDDQPKTNLSQALVGFLKETPLRVGTESTAPKRSRAPESRVVEPEHAITESKKAEPNEPAPIPESTAMIVRDPEVNPSEPRSETPTVPDMDAIRRMIEEEVTRRIADIPTMAPEAPSEPLLMPLPQTSPALDEKAIDERIAHALSGIPKNDQGIPMLVEAIGSLVKRMDAAAAAPVTPAPVIPFTANAALEIAEREETIASLREELRSERETAENLLSETDARRMAAEEEVATLRAALNDRRRQSDRFNAAEGGPQYPSDLSGLADWLRDNVLPNVVVTTKAYRAMRKVRYSDMERLCRTLALLDGPYTDMRAGIAGARDRWLEGLKELRLDNKKQSEMGKGVREGAEYSFTHDGFSWDMDWHLRGLERVHNEHDRLLRIYYAYDEEKGRVLIGHMPTHLHTVES